MLAIHGIETDELLHGLVLHRIFILASTVGPKNGVFYKGHFPAEAGSNSFSVLLVADGAIHTVKGHGIRERLEQRVVFCTLMMGSKVADRRVTTGAFVFQSSAMAGVGEHFVSDFGPPKWVFGAVGHDRTAPIVDHIHVVAIENGLHGEYLSRNRSEAVGVFTMTTCTFSRAVKQCIDGVRQTTKVVASQRYAQRFMGVYDGPWGKSTQLPSCAGPSAEQSHQEKEVSTTHVPSIKKTPPVNRAGSMKEK